MNDRWLDLYALLGVPEDAHPREIDEAIVGRSAECLQFAFARGAGSEFISLLEEHMPEFRHVLLREAHRAQYDELLAKHRAGEPAVSYEEFIADLPASKDVGGCLSMLVWFALGGATLLHYVRA